MRIYLDVSQREDRHGPSAKPSTNASNGCGLAILTEKYLEGGPTFYFTIKRLPCRKTSSVFPRRKA